MSKNIKVTRETPSGRNTQFKDGNRTVSRPDLVREIKAGEHPDYHVRVVHGVPTPVSNPDGKRGNNLG